jgi:hypothetical protein
MTLTDVLRRRRLLLCFASHRKVCPCSQASRIDKELHGGFWEPTPLADDTFERATISRVAWRLLPFLCLMFIWCLIDRVNLAFAALT